MYRSRTSHSLFDSATIPVTFQRDSRPIQLQIKPGPIVGELDSRYSKIIQVLQNEEGVESEAYLTSMLPKSSSTCHGPLRYGNKKAVRTNRSYTLLVIFYGSISKLEDVGNFFSQCSEYLQPPSKGERNVPYRNPQSLSGRDPNPPMTFELQDNISLSQVETLAQGVDPSAALEADGCLPETEPPSFIRTPLYR